MRCSGRSWQTEESLNTYAILGAEEYSQLLTKALRVNVDAARANTLAAAVPFIDRADIDRAMAAQNAPALADAALPQELDQDPEPGDDADDD